MFIKSRHHVKHQVEESWLPQLYSFGLKEADDIKRMNRRIQECSYLLDCKFVFTGEKKQTASLTITEIDKSSILLHDQHFRFIHIDNCTNSSCNVCAINETMKRDVNFVSPVLNFIKAHQSVGLIFNENQKPTNIVIDYHGAKYLYAVSTTNGSVRGIII